MLILLFSFFNEYLISAFIAIAMLVIAFVQTRIQKRNVKLALFVKRFKVYVDSQNLYQEYTHGYISHDTISNFICSFHASEMLFPKCSGIHEFLDEKHQSAVSFNGAEIAMKDTNEPTALEMVRLDNIKARSNLNDFLKDLKKLMKPYINID